MKSLLSPVVVCLLIAAVAAAREDPYLYGDTLAPPPGTRP